MPDWTLLHDATLVDAGIEWRTGEAHLVVRLSAAQPRPARLVISNCRSFQVSRRQPWGASVSINAVSGAPTPSGGVKLTIEIQSGDVIEIEGDVVALIAGDSA